MLPEFLRIARAEFRDIVTSAELLSRRASATEKLRLHLRDGSFADLWVNPSGSRYSFHWEHRAKRGLMHRYDNAPRPRHLSQTLPQRLRNAGREQLPKR